MKKDKIELFLQMIWADIKDGRLCKKIALAKVLGALKLYTFDVDFSMECFDLFNDAIDILWFMETECNS